jgi:hypothetical protein
MSASSKLGSALNVVRNLSDARLRPIILQKVSRRLTRLLKEREQGAKKWAAGVAEDHVTLCRKVDETLWNETVAYVRDFRREAEPVLAKNPALGGGGNYHLLYFLTRLLRPEVVMETGVAAGFSTHAILTALARNGGGRLFSSDFPYFRLANPERYVGILVPEALRDRWTLSLDGDSVAVPRFLSSLPKVDLFHYDSDKTYSGRTQTIDLALPKLSEHGVMLIDDIQDNYHFRDLIGDTRLRSRVFAFEGKYCGLVHDRRNSPIRGAE